MTSIVTTSKQRRDVTLGTTEKSNQFWTVLAFLLLPRLLSASYNIIHDTDETFNYWEPLYHLLHGGGFQTWEYSPIYAIRSWTYILLHAAPLFAVRSMATPVQQFYIVRGFLAVCSALTESYLVVTVKQEIGYDVASIFALILATSTGMFNASTALLPSSFTMYTSALGLAFALKGKYTRCVASFGIGAIIGWPFSIFLFLPIFLFSFARPSFPMFSYIRGSIVSVQVLLISVVTDYNFYGLWTIVPLNIVLYNVFSSRDGRGPELFGTEPWFYYLKNLVLNFNIVVPLALLAVPLSVFGSSKRVAKVEASLGFLIWFSIFTAQAHKEERFMYPAYPALVLSSAIGLHSMLDLLESIFVALFSVTKKDTQVLKTTCKYFIIILSAATSIFRIHSLVQNYSAPLVMFPQLPDNKLYCLGSDWYRFPTSFLLPSNSSLRFIESDFRGLLPGVFVNTSVVPIGMNDRNEWSADKIISPDNCDCIINWKAQPSETHRYYFLDRETGTRKAGYYGYDCAARGETAGDRLNRLGVDLFGRKLDAEGKRYEDGALADAIQRPSGWTG